MLTISRSHIYPGLLDIQLEIYTGRLDLEEEIKKFGNFGNWNINKKTEGQRAVLSCVHRGQLRQAVSKEAKKSEEERLEERIK